MLINYSPEIIKRLFKFTTIQIYVFATESSFLCTRDWNEHEVGPESYGMACWLPFGISHWNFQITLLVMIDRIQLPKHKKRQKSEAE